jgi:hypothetical protein
VADLHALGDRHRDAGSDVLDVRLAVVVLLGDALTGLAPVPLENTILGLNCKFLNRAVARTASGTILRCRCPSSPRWPGISSRCPLPCRAAAWPRRRKIRERGYRGSIQVVRKHLAALQAGVGERRHVGLPCCRSRKRPHGSWSQRRWSASATPISAQDHEPA